MPERKGEEPRGTGNGGDRTGMSSRSTEVFEALKNCRLFSDLTDEQIRTLSAAFVISDHAAGESIFRQGDPGDSIHVIERGLVNLQRMVDTGERNMEISVSYLGPRRLIGCWACLLDETNYLTESAVCQKPTRVITAKGADLIAVFEADPLIMVTMLKELCRMLGDKVQGIYGALESL